MKDVVSVLSGLAPVTDDDFSRYGPVEVKPLAKIQRIVCAMLGRNWVTIPHVTHHDEVDVTTIEHWRAAWNASHPEAKVTPVAYLAKVMAMALADNPVFNTSLCSDGQSYVQKHYANIGVAVDSPKGLVVAVLRDAAAKTVPQIAQELALLAGKARSKGLSHEDMAGSSITLSSLGHIGGTAFTPIINAPDVATMGALAITDRPARADDGSIDWRRVLPVSLSYDHRVVNGVDAARYVKAIAGYLGQPETLT